MREPGDLEGPYEEERPDAEPSAPALRDGDPSDPRLEATVAVSGSAVSTAPVGPRLTPQAWLDPERRIGPVPGAAPWEQPPVVERGLRPGVPVVYGTRAEGFFGSRGSGADDIVARLGPPPDARPVVVRRDRALLPSVERRSRRLRRATLASYAAALVLAGTGLWAIGALVLG